MTTLAYLLSFNLRRLLLLVEIRLLMNKKSLLAYLGGASLALPAISFGQIFMEGFDTAGSSAAWNVQTTSADTSVMFGWDYSTLGIPEAQPGKGTFGVRMAANMASPNTVEGVSMVPTSLVLPTNYTVSFDMWINANGPFPGGGAGSTEFGTFGIGANGNQVQWSGAAGQTLAVSGEGGSTSDYRFYGSGTLAAGANNTDPYYTTAFPGQTAPALQQANYAQQNAEPLQDGTMGFAWRKVEIDVAGTTATWTVDGTLLATVTDFDGSGNVFLGYYDPFTSVSDNADLSFGVYDNFQVIPEPSTYAAIFGGLALVGAFVYRRRKNQA